ncbi:hypothetical protein RJT34_25419 [Clitoria ternatea]|uniref:Uncharacterized protein n=1 Tax=Clitoria ternatea TaxID=43366 RepID=A0AAN9FSJ2_CLITE
MSHQVLETKPASLDACRVLRVHCRYQSTNGRVSRMLDLEGIIEALSDPNVYMIGVCGNHDDRMGNHLDTVVRRVTREGLFGVFVMVTITEKPNLRRILDEIANQLGFSYQKIEKKTNSFRGVFPGKTKKNKDLSEYARQLSDKIRTDQPKVLFILRDLHTKFDLSTIGVDHRFCKLIITSQSEDTLSNQMNAQRTFSLRL